MSCNSLLKAFKNEAAENEFSSSSAIIYYINFTLGDSQATSIEPNHSHFLCISIVRRKYHSENIFTQEFLVWETHSHVDASLNSKILTSSS